MSVAVPPPVPWIRREYLIEATGLALFMVSACVWVAALQHPASPLHGLIPSGDLRRALIGVAMGLTAVSLIYSPWGKRSGAHFNPAVTLTFFRLGKVAPRDLIGYTIAQFAGGTAGLALASLALGGLAAHPAVNYVATAPAGSPWAAFGAEFFISGLLMTVVLQISNRPRLAPYTGIFAACCVALFITLEAPISGMSMNPARTFASFTHAGGWGHYWVYLLAPPLGMLSAAALYQATATRGVACAKLRHVDDQPCLFCDYQRRLKKVLESRDSSVIQNEKN